MTLDARETSHYAKQLRRLAIGGSAVLLVGPYVDCMRVYHEAVGQDVYEMPSLAGSFTALESVAIAISLNISQRVWLLLVDVDRHLQKDPQRVTALKMLLRYQKQDGFPMVATTESVTPELFGLFPTHIHLEPLSGSGRTMRRFHTREAFDAEEDTFDGLMGLPSFRRRQR